MYIVLSNKDYYPQSQNGVRLFSTGLNDLYDCVEFISPMVFSLLYETDQLKVRRIFGCKIEKFHECLFYTIKKLV